MRIIVGISGASGVIYGWALLKYLKQTEHEVHAVVTDTGWKVLEHECAVSRSDIAANVDYLHEGNNYFAPIASGSFKTDAMVVVPCTMRTLGAIANGIGDNLLCRAADVMLKERRQLIIVPRETPYNAIHLSNMLKLAQLGVTIAPASPAFYHRPQTVEDLVNSMVGRICDCLHIPNELFERWTGM
jgi:4-hydroxy-3-polyprenylbenzoate decarboxylase